MSNYSTSSIHRSTRILLETFSVEKYKQLVGIDLEFVQDNHSRSVHNVLRGLHFQKQNNKESLSELLLEKFMMLQ